MNRPSMFSPVLLITLVALVIGVLLLGFYVQTREGSAAHVADTLGPTSYSRSAIGYAGLAGILESLSIPSIKSRDGSRNKTEGGLLIIAEPNMRPEVDAELGALLKADKVLIILPKWYGQAQLFRWSWIAYAYQRSIYDAQRVLNLAAGNAQVERVDAVRTWTVNTFAQTPVIEKPVQLMKSADMRPLIAAPEGILLGEVTKGGQRIWVLSDPDVLSNHGLGENGEKNAVLAVELIKLLRGNSGKVVFDEAVHGYMKAAAPSSAKTLLQFPYSVVAALSVLAVVLLLWATMGRFGTPERAPAALAAGKEGLVENVARLMEYAGHERPMVLRYVEATIRDAARQLHAPKGLTDPELAEWMGRVGRARGVTLDSTAILRRAEDLSRYGRSDFAAFAGIARDIYRWKQEITDGPSRRTRDH